jgi:hypothetical protein
MKWLQDPSQSNVDNLIGLDPKLGNISGTKRKKITESKNLLTGKQQ